MILLTNSKIEDEIISHFKENYKSSTEDYDCYFTFEGYEINVPYYIDFPIYKNEEISAKKGGISYCDKDVDHFKIRRMEQNPNSEIIGKRIQDVIDEIK